MEKERLIQMISTTLYFNTINESVLLELDIKNLFRPDTEILQELLDDKEIQRFIELSKRVVNKNDLSNEERKEFFNLLQNKKVIQYLETVSEGMKKQGFIGGTVFGGIYGGILGAGTALAKMGTMSGYVLGTSGSMMPVAVMAIVGAIAGGFIVGSLAHKVAGIIEGWRNKENLKKRASGITATQIG